MQKAVTMPEFQAGPRPDEDDGVDLFAVLRTLWREKLWVLLAVLLAVALGGWYAFVAAVPTYRATAQMALQVREAPVLDIDSVISGIAGDEASMNTEMAIIRSRALIERLVDQRDLLADPEFNEALAARTEAPGLLDRARGMAAAALGRPAGAPPTPEEERRSVVTAVRDAVTATSGRGTYVFSIAATSTDADKSAAIVNTLARLYQEDQVQVKVDATDAAATWLSARVSELRTDLEARESEIATLRSSNALLSEAGVEAINTQAVALRGQLQAAQSLLSRAGERRDALAAAGDDVAGRAEAAQDGQLDAIAPAAAGGDAGALLRFDRRFAQLRLQAGAEVERATLQVRDLQRAVDDLSAQFEGQSGDVQRLGQLEQEAEATRVLYETFLTRLRETSVQQGVHQADSRILSEATPGTLVAPRKPMILALSLILGLLAGAALVLGREMLQNGFRTAEDLEARTGLTVLGQVPRIPAKGRPATVAYLRAKPTSAAAEAIRNLRTSVLLSDVDRPPRVVMSTSSIPGEGKTTTAIALAQNLAGLEKRVLLIEGDIRRRTFGAYFPDAKEKGGLLSVISGKMTLEEALHRPEGVGIDVLMGERSQVNAADVFSSESFRRLLEQVRGAYDHVIIDTPPVLVVPDARVIAQLVDAVIYVVRWDGTSRAQVEEGLKQFRSVNVPVTGLVLSQIDPRGMRRYGYGGRYGAYSRYAQGYYEA